MSRADIPPLPAAAPASHLATSGRTSADLFRDDGSPSPRATPAPDPPPSSFPPVPAASMKTTPNLLLPWLREYRQDFGVPGSAPSTFRHLCPAVENALSKDVERYRCRAVECITWVCHEHDMCSENIFGAVEVLDRFLDADAAARDEYHPAWWGLACLQLYACLTETSVAVSSDFVSRLANRFDPDRCAPRGSSDQVISVCCWRIVRVLRADLWSSTIRAFIVRRWISLQTSPSSFLDLGQSQVPTAEWCYMSKYCAQWVLYDRRLLLRFTNAELAAACMFVARIVIRDAARIADPPPTSVSDSMPARATTTTLNTLHRVSMSFASPSSLSSSATLFGGNFASQPYSKDHYESDGSASEASTSALSTESSASSSSVGSTPLPPPPPSIGEPQSVDSLGSTGDAASDADAQEDDDSFSGWDVDSPQPPCCRRLFRTKSVSDDESIAASACSDTHLEEDDRDEAALKTPRAWDADDLNATCVRQVIDSLHRLMTTAEADAGSEYGKPSATMGRSVRQYYASARRARVADTFRLPDRNHREIGRLPSRSLSSSDRWTRRNRVAGGDPNGDSSPRTADWEWIDAPPAAGPWIEHETVGRGTYGIVNRVEHAGTKVVYALKRCKTALDLLHETTEPKTKDRLGKPPSPPSAVASTTELSPFEQCRWIVRELVNMKYLCHPNLVPYCRVFVHEAPRSSVAYLLPYFSYGSLEHVMYGSLHRVSLSRKACNERRDAWPSARVRSLGRQLFAALAYMHAHGVLHRDIKPANILLRPSDSSLGVGVGDHVALCDFGISRRVVDTADMRDLTGEVCTLWYRPIDLLLGRRNYGTTADVWSAALIVLEATCGRPVFDGGDVSEMVSQVCQTLGTPDEVAWPGVRSVCPEWRTHVSPHLHKRSCKMRHWTRLAELAIASSGDSDSDDDDAHAKGYGPAVVDRRALQTLGVEGATLILQRALAFDPEIRASAQDLSRHSFFSRVV